MLKPDSPDIRIGVEAVDESAALMVQVAGDIETTARQAFVFPWVLAAPVRFAPMAPLKEIARLVADDAEGASKR